MAGNNKQRIVEGCDGCVRIRGVTCSIILNPKYIWEANGSCFARVEDQGEVDRVEQEMLNYRSGKSGEIRS